MRQSDMHAALETLNRIGEASTGVEAFARHGVASLPRLVASELTTLSVCDLGSGHRSVVSDRPGAISKPRIQVFDRHLFNHPLVRDHARNPRAVTRRMSDVLPSPQFRRTALFNDYYRPIRLDHVMAVPIHVHGNLLVSFVLNRTARDFSDRDRACLELIRPHLGNLYRLSRAMQAPAAARRAPDDLPLTAREREVLQWLANGKTDRDIGEILGVSPRTVQKHLQCIYEKLGVENRTGAAMRLMRARA